MAPRSAPKQSRDLDSVVLSDPRAIRVLAHEARLKVLDELVLDEVEMTASELAARVGISPSAMSYHLRLLERYGLVARAEPRADGRERPWVRTTRGIQVRTSGSAAGEAAQSLVIQQIVQDLHDRWDAWSRAEPTEGEEWRDAGSFNRTRVWVTAEELRVLTEAIDEALETHRLRRSPADRPIGSREVDVLISLVPRPTA